MQRSFLNPVNVRPRCETLHSESGTGGARTRDDQIMNPSRRAFFEETSGHRLGVSGYRS